MLYSTILGCYAYFCAEETKGEEPLPIQIQNARILTPFAQQDGAVLISGDRIVDVNRGQEAPRGTKLIDAKNLYLVPGYIDIHAHGGGGRLVMEGSADAIEQMVNAHAMDGTTTIMPTTTTAPLDEIERAIDAVRDASARDCDGTIAGVHMQGPFLSPTYMAQAVRPHLILPTEEVWRPLIDRWDGLRIMGISPELPGAHALGDALRLRGVIASIAHSTAGYDQVLAATSHGFSDVTNIYAKTSTLRVDSEFPVPGVTECALAMDELSLQLVADGRRLPLMLLQVIFRCKGAESILLVTDAKAGTPEENTATMALLVRNMVAAGVSLRVALRMATVNPARRIGLDHCKGRIGTGYDADILLLDDSLNVRFCMARGKILRNELDSI